ncbi:unnamed protein product [Debaryomyces fabryi]|nr:unnamed protein product [Debaryomyces fabryi]
MATLDFTTKPFALERSAPRRGIEPRSTMRQTVILATKLSRMFSGVGLFREKYTCFFILIKIIVRFQLYFTNMLRSKHMMI